MTDIAILGASGYGGGELLRWLSVHPAVRIAIATSGTYAGQPVERSFPGLARRLDLSFAPDATVEQLAACGIVFMARDNGAAMRSVPALVEAGCRVVDLSADFRFRDTAVYEAWYKGPHAAADLAAGAVYGMPELHRDAIRSAIVVGNPGCYTTAAILALAPLVVSRRSRVPGRRSEREPLVELDSIVIDAKSGVSGAGRSKFGLAYHFSEVNESVAPYGVGGKHRHTPEIEQELSALAGAELRVSFTPHLVPITRGIVATCYARLAEPVEAEELVALYREFFRDEPFVNVCDGIPASKHAVGSNLLHIGLAVDERTRRVTAVGALDNLGKGMVGQAVQNMNILLGIDETTGLTMPGLWP